MNALRALCRKTTNLIKRGEDRNYTFEAYSSRFTLASRTQLNASSY